MILYVILVLPFSCLLLLSKYSVIKIPKRLTSYRVKVFFFTSTLSSSCLCTFCCSCYESINKLKIQYSRQTATTKTDIAQSKFSTFVTFYLCWVFNFSILMVSHLQNLHQLYCIYAYFCMNFLYDYV